RYPDLIVLDLNLPHMSGLEFLDVVKNDPELRRIPVLVFSSSTSDADIAASYDRYASGYLSKPMGPSDYDTILKTVEAYWFRLLQTSPAEEDRARLRREPESDDNR
ncbi:MAG: response regulator, partial [Asticcacaulis sp.]|nr:response regulator [Asticcacaulis sp.]